MHHEHLGQVRKQRLAAEQRGNERCKRRQQKHAPAAKSEQDEQGEPDEEAEKTHASALRQQDVEIGGRLPADVGTVRGEKRVRGQAPLGAQHRDELPFGVELG